MRFEKLKNWLLSCPLRLVVMYVHILQVCTYLSSLRKERIFYTRMNQYSNPEHTGDTGPGYTNGYQSQPYPPQQPQQFQQPGYHPPQPMPGYPPQTPPVTYPPQQPMQQGYPQQQMIYPQQMPYQQPMMQPQMMMMPQMNVNVNVGNQSPQQVSMLVRIIYFCFVGWWLGMFWLGIALSLMATIIGLPIGLMMINRTGAIMTLSRR